MNTHFMYAGFKSSVTASSYGYQTRAGGVPWSSIYRPWDYNLVRSSINMTGVRHYYSNIVSDQSFKNKVNCSDIDYFRW